MRVGLNAKPIGWGYAAIVIDRKPGKRSLALSIHEFLNRKATTVRFVPRELQYPTPKLFKDMTYFEKTFDDIHDKRKPKGYYMDWHFRECENAY